MKSEWLWPAERLADAVALLVSEAKLSRVGAGSPAPPPENAAAMHRWLEAVLQAQHVESVRGALLYEHVDQLLSSRVPLIIRVVSRKTPRNPEEPEEPVPVRYLILLGGRRCIDSAQQVRRVSREELRRILCEDAEADVAEEVDAFMDRVRPRRREAARNAMLRAQIGERVVGTYWELRRSVAAPLGVHLRAAVRSPLLAALILVQLLEYALWIATWTWGSRAALAGSVDRGWLLGWILVLVSLVPVRMLVIRIEGLLALRMADFLKRRLLVGALRLDPDEMRASGVGELVGHASEADAFETIAHAGAIMGILSAIELVIAAALLWLGAGGPAHAAVLLAWTCVAAAASWRYYESRAHWARGKLGLTHDMIEKIIGQRTRVVQQPPSEWHGEEDRQVRDHLRNSMHMDRGETALLAMPPLWTVLGTAALIPVFLGGDVSTPDLVASVGGIVLAALSLGKLIAAAPALADAAIVWRQIASTFRAAERPLLEGVAGVRSRRADVVMTASDVSFSYPSRGLRQVLSGCTLTIREGDRILLDAPSGAGKSTLLSLLTGLRRPTSGVLLLDGLDLHTLGETEWRRRAAAAPQFHDNHVFADTIAFNLLMGRQWPPHPQDMEEAETVCRELGLGDLLDRMPSGLLQMIGDAGWQLSHGEKSRLFVARALLQDAELVALDESFAALDPANFERCVQVVTRRAKTLLLVAHT